MFDEFFKTISKQFDSLDQLAKTNVETLKLRFLMWFAEMCLKYDKKPAEISQLIKECIKEVRKWRFEK